MHAFDQRQAVKRYLPDDLHLRTAAQLRKLIPQHGSVIRELQESAHHQSHNDNNTYFHETLPLSSCSAPSPDRGEHLRYGLHPFEMIMHEESDVEVLWTREAGYSIVSSGNGRYRQRWAQEPGLQHRITKSCLGLVQDAYTMSVHWKVREGYDLTK